MNFKIYITWTLLSQAIFCITGLIHVRWSSGLIHCHQNLQQNTINKCHYLNRLLVFLHVLCFIAQYNHYYIIFHLISYTRMPLLYYPAMGQFSFFSKAIIFYFVIFRESADASLHHPTPTKIPTLIFFYIIIKASCKYNI